MNGVLPVARLRRFRLQADHREASRCELCAAAVATDHGHLHDRQDQTLVCACGPCRMLFERAAEGARWRTVPDRVLVDPATPLEVWDGLGIPVGLAFVVRTDGELVVRYPGPAGVVDGDPASGPALAAAAATPLLRLLEPDVEAVIVHRTAGRTRAVLAPVTVGYRLAGELRRAWTGFHGGEAVSALVTVILDEVEGRAVSVARADP